MRKNLELVNRTEHLLQRLRDKQFKYKLQHDDGLRRVSYALSHETKRCCQLTVHLRRKRTLYNLISRESLPVFRLEIFVAVVVQDDRVALREDGDEIRLGEVELDVHPIWCELNAFPSEV